MGSERAWRWSWLPVLASLVLGGQLAWASPDEARSARRWVATWASSQQVPETRNALPDEDLRDATLRQVVRVTIGGERLRIRVSNVFGTEPLRVEAVTVARSADPASARINRASLRAVRFGGREGVTIPAGAEHTSDPVELAAPAMTHLTVSLYLPEAPARQTSHPGSRATSYLVHGRRTGAADLPAAQTVTHWYQLSGLDVEACPDAAAIAILGDSITDGYGVQPNTDQRWPDFFVRRLQADPATRHLAVVNHGIGGNRVTLDELGPNALARFERDVLAQAGVRYLIVLEGVNDLGRLTRDAPASPEAHRALVENIIGAYRQMVMRARERGIRAIGATILPYGASGYYHPDAANEADRQAINAWIRAPGNFDAVIDFDAVMRDPVDSARMRRDVDSGDGLHPSIAGYETMANAVPLSLFSNASSARNGPALAITFDDIPIHGPLPAGMTRLDIVRAITAALREAGVPEAYGFVNAAATENEPDLGATLDAWRDAGYPLGKHGWRHANLNAATAEAYVAEIARNEAMLARGPGVQHWRWYRYPFLAEGDEPSKRLAVRRFLADRHYRIAGVTMSFGDYLWNEPYARCLAANDAAGIAELERTYLEAAQESITHDRDASRRLYGRDIPYVLLMHVGAFDARMLPRLLALYRSEGFRFVPLAEATRDPAYASDVDPSAPPSPVGLDARLAARGAAVSPRRSYGRCSTDYAVRKLPPAGGEPRQAPQHRAGHPRADRTR